MRKNVFTKKFDDKKSLDEFINNCLGEYHYYDIRPNNVNIDGLNVTITMRCSRNFWCRKEILENNGFAFEVKES